ncbi:MAG: type II toxin-antitoxin system VapC family toxin [Gemmatimonadetes bacterium]|nr:type II toxin-antitoxin system VapC family toxin [Gemmatimonadota bacterium]
MAVLFIDANIPMYLVGAPHPNRERASWALERAIAAGDRLVTDAEVFQEILHRCAAIRRPEAVDACFDTLLGVVDEVFAIEGQDVRAARGLLTMIPGLSARDAVHAAVMRRHGVRRVLSFDRGFDRLGDLERIP